MKPLAAEVLYNGQMAGILQRTTSQFSFRYTPAYLAGPLPAISLTLPKRDGAFVSPVLFSFFSGLLAEGVAKRIQCRTLNIDEQDEMLRLVKTAHSETIGAVTIREVSSP
ncbi:HipA N-terminal domain-containing protein [Hymenobacter terrestris]|uniref:HipA N-terminal domain-containing protein n=1 Tax=Hymenobacter terrestris TaxID=2748310 RepID=A0ABX2Q185_9BACT|nr:HipA N-terminal domain-containing protein [Hymenobacter terrestris]NVO83562.1 HipA N-terminal domain-containing protein [Hymenobacter terrestris]